MVAAIWDLASGGRWDFSTDVPQDLAFAAHIGRREGFDVGDRAPASAAEAEWRTWWETLPGIVQALRTEEEAAFRAYYTGQGEPGPPPSRWIEPPDFPALSTRPLVRELCRRHWSGFSERWERDGARLRRAVEQIWQTVDVLDVVTQCCEATGIWGGSFHLRLDFVEWPEDYERVDADDHLILGLAHLESQRGEALREVLRSRITGILLGTTRDTDR